MVRIAGLIYPGEPVDKTIYPMLKVYRGEPYTYTKKRVQLGQAGKEIAFNGKKTIALVFDGQIWNKEELKKSLQFEGAQEELFYQSL